jgi:high-affinity nickel-transport protein
MKANQYIMAVSILILHLLGFGIFILFVLPEHYRGLGIGIGVLAYTLGLRHAFDADHIAAIDNTTRKLLHERTNENSKNKPLSVGYWFSLGHSTVVILVGSAIVLSEKFVYRLVSNGGSGFERYGGIFGTIVSAVFLYLIAILNILIIRGLYKIFSSLRKGIYDEVALEKQLLNRGLMNRFFGRWMKTITKEWHMYPVGFLFGLGFDTATEVALLATTALLASRDIQWYAILSLPILFTAGMCLMDTLDGVLMNSAYDWAFKSPVRKLYYNLIITGLSVMVCLFVGSIELLGLVPTELHLHGSFWNYTEGFNINTAGFFIVGMFIVVWTVALILWRFGKIESKIREAA